MISTHCNSSQYTAFEKRRSHFHKTNINASSMCVFDVDADMPGVSVVSEGAMTLIKQIQRRFKVNSPPREDLIVSSIHVEQVILRSLQKQ